VSASGGPCRSAAAANRRSRGAATETSRRSAQPRDRHADIAELSSTRISRTATARELILSRTGLCPLRPPTPPVRRERLQQHAPTVRRRNAAAARSLRPSPQRPRSWPHRPETQRVDSGVARLRTAIRCATPRAVAWQRAAHSPIRLPPCLPCGHHGFIKARVLLERRRRPSSGHKIGSLVIHGRIRCRSSGATVGASSGTLLEVQRCCDLAVLDRWTFDDVYRRRSNRRDFLLGEQGGKRSPYASTRTGARAGGPIRTRASPNDVKRGGCAASRPHAAGCNVYDACNTVGAGTRFGVARLTCGPRYRRTTVWAPNGSLSTSLGS